MFPDLSDPDVESALALVHHLAISNNVPLKKIAEFFSQISNFLIIEFIPKSDSQVKRLLLTREDIFENYDEKNFETEFKREESQKFLAQVQKNALSKIAEYLEMYPEVSREINWMENWQYITYRPPKHMTYHSDNHSVRDPRTNQHYPAPYFRRITCLTYLNDDFHGGALDFRYFDHEPYKPPAGSVVIMPSSYMWSHATTPLLNGRKAAFLVSCSSHFDEASFKAGATMEYVTRRELR